MFGLETSPFGSDEATTESLFDIQGYFPWDIKVEFKVETKEGFALASGECMKVSQSLFETVA